MEERRRRVAGTLAIAFVGCIAGAVACQQVLGIDGAVTVEPSESVACGLRLKRGTCQACIEQKCCDQARTCGKDLACAGYESCLLGCGADYACRSQCSVDHIIGNVADVPALDTCAVTSCENECGIVCGAVTSLSAPDAAAGCQDCIAAHACSAAEACGQSVDCQGIARCLTSCPTYDCQTACIDGRDAATALFTSTVFTGASTCYAACGIGSYWGCVGRVSRPIAKDRNILFTVTLVDSAQRTGLAGLAVKACEVGDGACSSPLASGTTDAKGTVTLPLTVQPSTAYGFQGFLDISSPAIVPYLFFLSFSLSEPHASIELPLLTTAGLANLVSLAGVTLDPARGHLAAVANDCLLNGAPNVVVDADGIDATTQRRYLDGSFLSSSATTTDRSGLVFFLNAPPTAIALRATPRAIDRVSGRASVFVRAGTLSLVQVNPSP